jgi:hypothetical protein
MQIQPDYSKNSFYMNGNVRESKALLTRSMIVFKKTIIFEFFTLYFNSSRFLEHTHDVVRCDCKLSNA